MHVDHSLGRDTCRPVTRGRPKEICPCAHWSSRRPAPASTWSNGREPDRRPRRRQDPGPAGRPVRHRPAPRAVGRLGRLDGDARRWSSATSSTARSSRSARTSPRSPVGQRASGEGHIVCGTCRNCRAGRRQLCIRTRASASTATAPSPTTSCIPAAQRVGAARRPRPRPRRRLRPAGQRRPHRAVSFPMAGEDVAHHRRRPDRGHGGGASRATSAPATSSSPTSATTASTWPGNAGADLVVNVATTQPAEAHAPARHEGGLRRRPGDVRQPPAPSRTCSPT